MIGPGKYDDLCTHVREATNADAVVIIVFQGNLGSGFSVQMTNPTMLYGMPTILEDLAREVRANLKERAERGGPLQ